MKEKFSYEKNGYNRQEVNELIEFVIEKSEGLVSECEEQRKIISGLEKELNYYKNLANDTKKESENIIYEAKINASRILNEALIKANEVESKRKLLEKDVSMFKLKLKNIISELENIE